jgi:hypothetical protein
MPVSKGNWNCNIKNTGTVRLNINETSLFEQNVISTSEYETILNKYHLEKIGKEQLIAISAYSVAK